MDSSDSGVAGQAAAPAVRTREVPGPGAVLGELAAITRVAFADGDQYPGLPAADGVTDTAASLAADMRSGVRLWLAQAGDGTPVGCVRVIQRSASSWQIRRLAVLPQAQGSGVARSLILALESAALAEGVGQVVVWALVERGIAPFYSNLGYRTTGHFASPGKLLSEAIMELRTGQPRIVLSYPWGTEPRLAGKGVLVSWFAFAGGTAAVLGPVQADARAAVRAHAGRAAAEVGPVRFIGGDAWLGAEANALAELRQRLAPGADTARGPLLLFSRPGHQITQFTIPRQLEPRLLALWRLPTPVSPAAPVSLAAAQGGQDRPGR